MSSDMGGATGGERGGKQNASGRGSPAALAYIY